MAKNRVFPCRINGKIYLQPVDFEEEIKIQVDQILQCLEEKLNTPTERFFHDEEFEKYIQDVKKGNIEKILNPKNQLYRTQFDLAVLQFGSYEFVQSLFLINDENTKNNYLDELDVRIQKIQNSLITFCKEQRQKKGINYTKRMQEIYSNYLEKFAPQRLENYTKQPINLQLLLGMRVLKEEALKSVMEAETKNLLEKQINFNCLYNIDEICQVFSLYVQLLKENDDSKKMEIYMMIDSLTEKGVSIIGNNQALINLSTPMSFGTLEQMIDSLVLRLKTYKHAKKLDLSVDFNAILEKMSQAKKCYSDDYFYSSNLSFQKLLQLTRLKVLPKKEKKLLEDFLNNEFSRENIESPDMSIFDKKIENEEEFSKEEVNQFFRNVMVLTAKDGIMPVKYNEFLLARMIEENKEFSENLNDINKTIILENCARLKSEKLLGQNYYITFSKNLVDENTAGQHQTGFIKIKQTMIHDQSMYTVLEIATILHEIRHGEQEEAIASKNYNHLMYMIAKEEILKNEDYGYYDRNYSTMYEELDAEFFALERTIKFVETLPMNPEFCQSRKWKQILEKLHERKIHAEQGFEVAKDKKNQNGKMVNVEEAFDKLVSEHPEALQISPILKVEYNEDGTRKPLSQIFEEFIEIMRFKENRLGNYDLYKYILFSRIGQNIVECFEFSDIVIPEDLSYSSRNALNKIKYAIINKGLEKLSPDMKPVAFKDIKFDDEKDEKITPKAKMIHEDIFEK